MRCLMGKPRQEALLTQPLPCGQESAAECMLNRRSPDSADGLLEDTSVRFVVVKLIYSGLNFIFDMNAIFTVNYFFSGR
jgi:hypothetical protein